MRYILKTFLLLFALVFSGCSYSKLDQNLKKLDLPETYNKTNSNLQIKEKWLNEFDDKRLVELVNSALNKNYNLKKMAFNIKIKEKELVSTNSVFFPSIDLSFNHSQNGNFESSNVDNSESLNLNVKYEVDIWNKLSDQEKRANIYLLESKALYKEAEQKLVADVANTYFDIVEAQKLSAVYEKNLKNANDFLSIIESRYKQGLSSALDVFSAKSSMYSQKTKLTQIHTVKKQAIYKLEQLLGEYPKGLLKIKKDIPTLGTTVNLGMPEELIFRKPSITASWNALLAKDFSLAIAHKNRFPSLSLSASLKDSLQSAVPITWSLIGGLSASVFDAGRLKSQEEIALYDLKKAELDYLDKVYNSFVEIESLNIQEKNLKEEYKISLENDENAKKSLDLSFSQYLKGIVEYTTVLNSQKSYYNSQADLITIKIKILKNAIEIHKTLGGDFL